jgi:hypothetical protein
MHHSLIDSWDINAYFTWVLRKIRREIASDNDRVVARQNQYRHMPSRIAAGNGPRAAVR